MERPQWSLYCDIVPYLSNGGTRNLLDLCKVCPQKNVGLYKALFVIVLSRKRHRHCLQRSPFKLKEPFQIMTDPEEMPEMQKPLFFRRKLTFLREIIMLYFSHLSCDMSSFV